MKVKKVNPRVALLSSLLLVFASISSESLAAWKVAKNTVNVVSTPGFGIDIIENYTPPEEGVSPGVDITKEVKVKNIGDSDCLVRVKLDKLLGHKVGDSFVKSEDLDINYIVLKTNDKNWELSEDGYYYYKGILNPGEETPEPLLESFKLSEDATDDKYKNIDGQVNVTAESIQYEGGAVKLWGKTYEELGVKKPNSWFDQGVSVVEFINKGTDFNIRLSDSDLFKNFKGLLPGTVRSQQITIRNKCDDSADIKLVQLKTVGIQEETVRDLLTKYVDVTIEDMDTKEVLYDGSLGTENGIEINFGDFASGQEKNLKVTCRADENMPNILQNIQGEVEWSFLANEVVKPVQTGVDYDIPWFNLTLLVVGVAVATISYRKVKSNEDSEESV